MDLTYAYVGELVKTEKTADGDLLVYGKAAGPDLDLDGQICDPAWLRKAIPGWAEWGNVREQHTAIAAGVGVETVQDGEDWHVKTLVTDKGTAHKVETKTLKGYSVGIRNARVVKDAGAPGGRIVGGEIVEISLVDRPCNPTAKMAICKSVGGSMRPVDEAGEMLGDDPASFGDGEDVLDDGTTAQAVDKAVQVDAPPAGEPVTKAEPAAPKPKPAKQANLLSARGYKAAVALVDKTLAGDLTKAVDESSDIAGAWAAVGQICDLIISEATELKGGRMEEKYDIETLCRALCALECFLNREAMQQAGSYGPGDSDSDDLGGEVSYISLMAKFVSAAQRRQYAKTGVAMSNGDFPIPDEGHLRSAVGRLANYKGDKAAARRHIIARARALGLKSGLESGGSADGKPKKGKGMSKNKAAESGTETPAVDTAGIAEIVNKAVAEATGGLKAQLDAARADLAKVMASPIPGGPVLIKPTATPANPSLDKAARYRAIAEQTTDPGVAAAYRAAARREAGAGVTSDA